MWFKQLSFYLINKNKLPTLDKLITKLSAAEFTPCSGLDWFNEGFSAPVSFSPETVFVADSSWRITLKKEEKVLPASVIRDILDNKITEIQNNEARNVGRKEKQELKEQITDDLLPRAFTRNSYVQAVFDTNRGYLFINQATAAKAENLLTKLREALGGLETIPLNTRQSLPQLMTSWLQNGTGVGGFELDSDCELKGTGNTAPVIKIANQNLTADEVIQHLQNGKTVTQLGLAWQEQIAFILTQDFTLKRIQYLDILQKEAESSGDDVADLTFASQILMTEALGTMIDELITHLGGRQQ